MAVNRFRGGRYKIDDLRSRFQTVALDNEYQVFFSLNESISNEAIRLGIDRRFLSEDLGLYVSDAILPGSSFGDIEVAGDRQGITERNAFSRIYDDVTFTLYVDRNYEVLRFFESWLQFINPLYSSVDRGIAKNQITKFNYPDDYKCEMVITKFNKDLKGSTREIGFANGLTSDRDQISYRFFRAWPLSLASTPVSYQGMNVLKCNVTFRYDRYIVSEVTYPRRPLAGDTIRGITEFNNSAVSGDFGKPQIVTDVITGNQDPETEPQPPIDQGRELPTESGGDRLREDLAIWALSNQQMIENRNRAPSNLESQDKILSQAQAQYPPGSPQRQQLLEKARALSPNWQGTF